MELIIKSDTLRIADLISDLLRLQIADMYCGLSDQRAAKFTPLISTLYCGHYTFMLQVTDPLPDPYLAVTVTVDETDGTFQIAVSTSHLLQCVSEINASESQSYWMTEVPVHKLLESAHTPEAITSKVHWANFKISEVDLAAKIIFRIFYKQFLETR